jgi:hypothetical protein
MTNYTDWANNQYGKKAPYTPSMDMSSWMKPAVSNPKIAQWFSGQAGMNMPAEGTMGSGSFGLSAPMAEPFGFSQPQSGMDWQKDWGFQGTGGFDGSGIENKGYLDKFMDWTKSSGLLGSLDTKTGMRTQGLGDFALSAISGLGSAYLANKQLDLSEEIVKNNKSQFERNFGAQQKLTNSKLEERQQNKVEAARNNGYAEPVSVAEYMKKYGV